MNEVLNHTACVGLVPGIQKVAAHELPNIRGSRLLTLPLSGNQVSDSQVEQPTDEVLLAISDGEKPSTGYQLIFRHARIEDGHLKLHYESQAPDPERHYPPMLTAPCSVVSIKQQFAQFASAYIDEQNVGSVAIVSQQADTSTAAKE